MRVTLAEVLVGGFAHFSSRVYHAHALFRFSRLRPGELPARNHLVPGARAALYFSEWIVGSLKVRFGVHRIQQVPATGPPGKPCGSAGKLRGVSRIRELRSRIPRRASATCRRLGRASRGRRPTCGDGSLHCQQRHSWSSSKLVSPAIRDRHLINEVRGKGKTKFPISEPPPVSNDRTHLSPPLVYYNSIKFPYIRIRPPVNYLDGFADVPVPTLDLPEHADLLFEVTSQRNVTITPVFLIGAAGDLLIWGGSSDACGDSSNLRCASHEI